MKSFYLKPAAGRRVLDPGETPPAPLPAEGKAVPRSAYWLRRIKDGDVVESTPPKTPKVATATAAEAKPSAKTKE